MTTTVPKRRAISGAARASLRCTQRMRAIQRVARSDHRCRATGATSRPSNCKRYPSPFSLVSFFLTPFYLYFSEMGERRRPDERVAVYTKWSMRIRARSSSRRRCVVAPGDLPAFSFSFFRLRRWNRRGSSNAYNSARGETARCVRQSHRLSGAAPSLPTRRRRSAHKPNARGKAVSRHIGTRDDDLRPFHHRPSGAATRSKRRAEVWNVRKNEKVPPNAGRERRRSSPLLTRNLEETSRQRARRPCAMVIMEPVQERRRRVHTARGYWRGVRESAPGPPSCCAPTR